MCCVLCSWSFQTLSTQMHKPNTNITYMDLYLHTYMNVYTYSDHQDLGLKLYQQQWALLLMIQALKKSAMTSKALNLDALLDTSSLLQWAMGNLSFMSSSYGSMSTAGWFFGSSGSCITNCFRKTLLWLTMWRQTGYDLVALCKFSGLAFRNTGSWAGAPLSNDVAISWTKVPTQTQTFHFEDWTCYLRLCHVYVGRCSFSYRILFWLPIQETSSTCVVFFRWDRVL